VELFWDSTSGAGFSSLAERYFCTRVFARQKKELKKRTYIIENFYGEKFLSQEPQEKNYVWAVRALKLKNGTLLKEAFLEAQKENPEIILDAGQVSHHELNDKITNCYAVILPSLSEVSPNVILNALRFNKPFILTKDTGLYEKLKDVGVFVNPLNKDDIKNKILLLADEKHYQEYRQRVTSFTFTHSWQEIVNEFLAIYKGL